MCIGHMNFVISCLELDQLIKDELMTKLSHAIDLAGKWLEIDGVDMIIPRPDTNEIVVVITCHPDSLKHLIPPALEDIQVKIRYEKYHAA